MLISAIIRSFTHLAFNHLMPDPLPPILTLACLRVAHSKTKYEDLAPAGEYGIVKPAISDSAIDQKVEPRGVLY